MNKDIPSFYRQFSQYTDPGLYGNIVKQTLPDDVRDIGLVVRKQIIHKMTLKNGNTGSNSDKRYGDMTKLPWYRQAEDDVFPTAAAMLAELFRRDPAGLTLDRKEENKLVVTCRFVSILMATLLKLKGIPSRVRSGFAPYFSVAGLPESTSDDHWINQYWDTNRLRWVTVDVDGSLEGYLSFDPYDIPLNTFDFSADAWLNVREGKKDENHFYNAGGFSGLVVIAWELFYDFHCLMNSEITYWHHPEIAMYKNFQKASEDQLKEIDCLAHLMQDTDKNFDALQHMWNTNRSFRLLHGGLI